MVNAPNDGQNVKKSSEDDIELPFDGEPTKAPPISNGEVIDRKTGEVMDKRPENKSQPQVQPKPEEPKTIVKIPAANEKTDQRGIKVLLATKKDVLKNFLGNEKNAMAFMSAVMFSVEKVPELLNCTAGSIMSAFMECAAIKLYPGSSSGDCYVLPYKGKAQFQLGYKGVKTLAYRSGVLRLWAEIRYEKDKFKQTLGTSPKIEHMPFNDDDDLRGEPIGAYACAEVNPGVVIFKYLPKSKIMKIKAKSPSAKSEYSPWNGNDPDLWMWKKCAVKQLGKTMPQSDEMKRAFYLDNVSEGGGHIESDGNIYEAAFENSDANIEQGKDKKEALRKKKQ